MTEHITLLLHLILLSLILLPMLLVLCRPMFTAVTVGMGVRQVSQVSYYCTALMLCIPVTMLLLVASEPNLLCCVQAKTINGSATSSSFSIMMHRGKAVVLVWAAQQTCSLVPSGLSVAASVLTC